MLKHVETVEPLDGYRLHLCFDDGAEGIVDLADLVQQGGVFTPLRESSFFRQVRVNPDSRTIEWPNGVDLDPDVLHGEVTGIAPLSGRSQRRAS